MTYGTLIQNLQILCQDYRFKILLVVICALRTILTATRERLRETKFSGKLKQLNFFKNYSVVRLVGQFKITILS